MGVLSSSIPVPGGGLWSLGVERAVSQSIASSKNVEGSSSIVFDVEGLSAIVIDVECLGIAGDR